MIVLLAGVCWVELCQFSKDFTPERRGEEGEETRKKVNTRG